MQESGLLIILFFNITRHADMWPQGRHRLLSELADTLTIIADSGLPFVVRLTTEDAQLGEVSSDLLARLNRMRTTYSQVMPSTIVSPSIHSSHVDWQIRHGDPGTIPVLSFAEFDPGQDVWTRFGDTDLVVPVCPSPMSHLYIGEEQRNLDTVLNREVAVRFGNVLIASMHHLEAWWKVYYPWIRDPSQKHEQLLVDAMKQARDSGVPSPIYVDGESGIIGSRLGVQEVLKRLVDVVRRSAEDAMISFGDFQKVAGSRALIAGENWRVERWIDSKWMGPMSSVRFWQTVGSLRPARTDREHAMMSAILGSDAQVVESRRRLGVRVLPSEGGDPIVISSDNTILQIRNAVLDAYRRGIDPVQTLRSLNLPQTDAQWFANQCADSLDRLTN